MDPEDIEEHILDYYRDLFTGTASPTDFFLVSEVIPSVLTNGDKLVKLPMDIEIKETVFDLDPHSPPDLDGFTGAFYKAYWSFLGRDVC